MKSKSIELADYDDIKDGLKAIRLGMATCLGDGIPVYIPHPHRMWEYGSAMQAYLNTFRDTPTSVLDVGCGKSPLGPSLIANTNARVTEVDPDERLIKLRGAPTAYRHFEVGDLLTLSTEQTYDAVFCISVIEHLKQDDQRQSWDRLGDLVKPGGLLVVTTDFGADSTLPWYADTEREYKFDAIRIWDAYDQLKELEFTLELDPTFYGSLVYDYTFFRFIARKLDATC